MVTPIGISEAGGSLASDYSGGFTGSKGSGGAVFSTGRGYRLITRNYFSSSWGSAGIALPLALGGGGICLHGGTGVKAWLYLPMTPMTWSHHGDPSRFYALSCWVHSHEPEQLYTQLMPILVSLELCTN